MPKNLIDIRKELHSLPELSGSELNTAKRISDYLSDSNPDQIIESVGGTGIIAEYLSYEPSISKSILIRAELDAIAIEEKTGMSHQSQEKGVMHGCGHDGHMTILLALAQKLKDQRFEDINVYLLFQPAEETGEGAEEILSDERFKNLKINHAFALHNIPGEQENNILLKGDVFAVASCGIEFKFTGKSSHAAHPEDGVNPSQAISNFLVEADKQLSQFRSKDALNKAVNTFIKLGEPAFGISPGIGRVGFTLRSKSDQELDEALKELIRLAEKINNLFQIDITHEIKEPFAATVNSSKGNEIVKKAAVKLGMSIKELDAPYAWSEDFGEFRKKCPITLFGLGAGVQSEPLHSDKYDFNDKLISVGADLFYTIIQEF